MATRTQTQTVAAKTAAGNGPGARVGVAPNRAFDHLYDKDYRVSGARDHARRQQAATNTARLVAVPNDTSMFSDLVHMPRNTVRLESTQRVPPSVVQDFSQLQQHAQVQASRDHATIEPSGRHNALFTGRPRIPYMRAHDATVSCSAARQRGGVKCLAQTRGGCAVSCCWGLNTVFFLQNLLPHQR